MDKYKHYLSIDCANKSLAIGFYSVIYDFKKDLKNINENNINKVIKINFLKVYDLIPDIKLKNSDYLERTKQLKITLNEVNYLISKYILNNNDINVLIEYQMNVNDKSRCIYNQIIYEYIDIYKIYSITPMYKNIIYLHKNLKYSNIMNISNNNYQCNKNHSKYNFLYFIIMFDEYEKLKDIRKKNYDDIADTFTQMIAFLIK
jgi:hypothetical protein